MKEPRSDIAVDAPAIRYATDTSAWADWQRAYRFGVLLILPPAGIAEEFNRLRQRYDPASAAISPTHISVSRPLVAELTDTVREEISGILSGVEPFELYFEKPHASPDYAGVSFPVYPQSAIDKLKQIVHRASVFDSAGHERDDIPAHITVAEFISIDESLALAARLEAKATKTTFTCDRLTLVVPDEHFRFREMASFAFKGVD
ncbi:MAG: 2'-5' RNA ligase family protein [Woeseiaceae bacterium]|nr:2'-5' RNA ligase family protein [Woeseiaceae bacterium]